MGVVVLVLVFGLAGLVAIRFEIPLIVAILSAGGLAWASLELLERKALSEIEASERSLLMTDKVLADGTAVAKWPSLAGFGSPLRRVATPADVEGGTAIFSLADDSGVLTSELGHTDLPQYAWLSAEDSDSRVPVVVVQAEIGQLGAMFGYYNLEEGGDDVCMETELNLLGRKRPPNVVRDSAST